MFIWSIIYYNLICLLIAFNHVFYLKLINATDRDNYNIPDRWTLYEHIK